MRLAARAFVKADGEMLGSFIPAEEMGREGPNSKRASVPGLLSTASPALPLSICSPQKHGLHLELLFGCNTPFWPR